MTGGVFTGVGIGKGQFLFRNCKKCFLVVIGDLRKKIDLVFRYIIIFFVKFKSQMPCGNFCKDLA